jgi:hypothetical protein
MQAVTKLTELASGGTLASRDNRKTSCCLPGCRGRGSLALASASAPAAAVRSPVLLPSVTAARLGAGSDLGERNRARQWGMKQHWIGGSHSDRVGVGEAEREAACVIAAAFRGGRLGSI